ncbi:MAG: DNA-processing protein DprA [Anaerolineales bacterium]
MSQYREAAYWLAALNATGLDRRAAKRAIHLWCVEKEHALSALFAQKATEVAAQCSIDVQQAACLLDARGDVPAKEALLQELEQKRIDLVTYVNVAYPESLLQHLSKDWLPCFLFYRGDLSILTEPTLAVFGDENPSSQAQEMTVALAELLTRGGYPVISGYSSGIERRAVDTVRAQGGRAAILLPIGIRRFDGCLVEMGEEIADSRLVVLSPYLPDATYTETLARAREVLVAALSEAIFIIAPDHGPGEWAWLERFQERSGRIFIWDDGGNKVSDWEQAGATPFQELVDAEDLLRDLFGVAPSDLEEKLEDEELTDMDPIEFIDADSAIEVLSQSGNVPDVLARRLRDTDWPEPQVPDDDL